MARINLDTAIDMLNNLLGESGQITARGNCVSIVPTRSVSGGYDAIDVILTDLTGKVLDYDAFVYWENIDSHELELFAREILVHYSCI